MDLDPQVKKNWIEVQKKVDYPVNAIGLRIDPRDQSTLDVWRKEGIDKFLERGEG